MTNGIGKHTTGDEKNSGSGRSKDETTVKPNGGPGIADAASVKS